MLQKKKTGKGNAIMAKNYDRIMCRIDKADKMYRTVKYLMQNWDCRTKNMI